MRRLEEDEYIAEEITQEESVGPVKQAIALILFFGFIILLPTFLEKWK